MRKWLFGNPSEVNPPAPFRVGDRVIYASSWGRRIGVVQRSSRHDPDTIYVLDEDWGNVVGVKPENVFKD